MHNNDDQDHKRYDMIIIEDNGKISDRIIGQNLHNSYDHDHECYDQDHENSSNDDMMIIKERIVGQNLHSNNDHYHELVAKETTPKNDDLLVKWQFWPRVLIKTSAKWKIIEKLIMIILSSHPFQSSTILMNLI